MNKPKRVWRKARFRVGQVVFSRRRGYVPPLTLFLKIKQVSWLGGYWKYASGGPWFNESELRPLNAKEIGPRRERGQ